MLEYQEVFHNYTIKVYKQTPDKDWVDFFSMSEEQQDLNDQFAPLESKANYRYEIVADNMVVKDDNISMDDIASAVFTARWDIFIVYEKAVTSEARIDKIYKSIRKPLSEGNYID